MGGAVVLSATDRSIDQSINHMVGRSPQCFLRHTPPSLPVPHANPTTIPAAGTMSCWCFFCPRQCCATRSSHLIFSHCPRAGYGFLLAGYLCWRIRSVCVGVCPLLLGCCFCDTAARRFLFCVGACMMRIIVLHLAISSMPSLVPCSLSSFPLFAVLLFAQAKFFVFLG